MGEQANADAVRRAYQAFNEGDGATLTEVFAEDAVWNAGGNNVLSGTFDGRDATFGMFAKIAELTGGTYRVAPTDVTAEGDAVTAHHQATAQRDGKSLDMPSTIRFRMVDGRIAEATEALSDQATFDAFIA